MTFATATTLRLALRLLPALAPLRAGVAMSADHGTIGARSWNAALGIWEGARAACDDLEVPDPLYIFGYGSLCWRADFAHDDSWIGHVRGWNRRFSQRSTDHRGTPEAPGLVVTLLADEELAMVSGAPAAASSACYGVCYRVGKADEASVLDNLDFREKGGYTRAIVEVYPQLDGTPVRAL
eukprot:3521674-Prymnesium_polylepis.1